MKTEKVARVRHVSIELQQVARALRKTPTLQEQRLWERLRRRGVDGLRFRRQHAVGQVVLDVYCPQCKLVVEIDGGIRDRQPWKDHGRDEALRSYDYHTIRFPNQQIDDHLEWVIERIRTEARLRLQQSQS